MKDEWVNYLNSIGIQDLFFERAREVIDFYNQVCTDEIEDIFVTEYIDKEGNRQYESVMLFSETSVMEAKEFLKKDDFDFAKFKNQIQYWTIEKTEYDFNEATAKSRMVLTFSLMTRIVCELKASRENCDYLKRIFLKYVIPNIIECVSPAQRIDTGNTF